MNNVENMTIVAIVTYAQETTMVNMAIILNPQKPIAIWQKSVRVWRKNLSKAWIPCRVKIL